MHKKAKLDVRTLVQLIFFVAITLLIALPACSRILGWWTAKPTSGTTKSVDAIRIEINNIYDQKEVNVFVDENHVIKIFNAESAEKPRFEGCKKQEDKSCICVCTASSCDVGNREVNICKAFDGDYFDRSHVINHKLVDEKAQIQICIFVKDGEDKVSLSGCS